MFRKTLLILAAILLFATAKTGCTGMESVTFDRLISQADKYNGLTVIVEGFYFTGFEIVALSGSLVPSDFYPGNLAPEGKLVWLEGAMPEDVYAKLYLQPNNVTGYPVHYGKVKLTGVFQTGKFGHLDAYQYKITIKKAESVSWSPPEITTGKLKIRVTDTAGKPLDGAKVVSDTQPEGQLKVTGITGDDGTVTFDNIRGGNHAFYVSRFNYVNREFRITVTGGQTASTIILLTQ